MLTKQFTLGLTGGIGSGKTTVASMFADLGVSIVDTDVIARDICEPNGIAIPFILESFGQDYILSSGAMDRNKMRELVFTNPEQRVKLENILHPLIRQETELALIKADGIYNIIVIPLLVESSYWRENLPRILVIDCEEEIQIERVMKRNLFSREQVLSIMANQATRKERLRYAHDVIQSNASLDHIRQQVALLHEKYALF